MNNNYKGIILAGGSGTRLNPITLGTSKQLLPIYDKPMIYYSLSVLMLAGIRDILIISTPEDIDSYKRLLGSGENIGTKFEYITQSKPNGLAEAFILGEKFIGNNPVSLVLGDNIFYGHDFVSKLENAASTCTGATIFGYYVEDPKKFGVMSFDRNGDLIDIEEKPKDPKTNYAVTGLYFYDNDVIEIAKTIKPSLRNELEITDINKIYLQNKKLRYELLGRGFAWLDTGSHDSLLEASNFVQTIEKRQGLKIACIEEIAYRKGWITKDSLIKQSHKFKNIDYGDYLLKITDEI